MTGKGQGVSWKGNKFPLTSFGTPPPGTQETLSTAEAPEAQGQGSAVRASPACFANTALFHRLKTSVPGS